MGCQWWPTGVHLQPDLAWPVSTSSKSWPTIASRDRQGIVGDYSCSLVQHAPEVGWSPTCRRACWGLNGILCITFISQTILRGSSCLKRPTDPRPHSRWASAIQLRHSLSALLLHQPIPNIHYGVGVGNYRRFQGGS